MIDPVQAIKAYYDKNGCYPGYVEATAEWLASHPTRSIPAIERDTGNLLMAVRGEGGIFSSTRVTIQHIEVKPFQEWWKFTTRCGNPMLEEAERGARERYERVAAKLMNIGAIVSDMLVIAGAESYNPVWYEARCIGFARGDVDLIAEVLGE